MSTSSQTLNVAERCGHVTLKLLEGFNKKLIF
jgi:hypothetical protein